jgi:hypothetical protein
MDTARVRGNLGLAQVRGARLPNGGAAGEAGHRHRVALVRGGLAHAPSLRHRHEAGHRRTTSRRCARFPARHRGQRFATLARVRNRRVHSQQNSRRERRRTWGRTWGAPGLSWLAVASVGGASTREYPSPEPSTPTVNRRVVGSSPTWGAFSTTIVVPASVPLGSGAVSYPATWGETWGNMLNSPSSPAGARWRSPVPRRSTPGPRPHPRRDSPAPRGARSARCRP